MIKKIIKPIIEPMNLYMSDKILVCPINEPNAKGRRMYVPRGKWYNLWTDELVDGEENFGLTLI